MENDILQSADNMQKLLKQYIEKYSQQSVVYENFKSEFEAFVDANYPDNSTTVKELMKWDTWVKVPGIPVDKLDFVTPNLTESQDLANEYIKLNGSGSPEKADDYKSWDSNLKVVFLEQLAQSKETNLEIIKKIDADLNITSTVDPECIQRWYPLGIMLNYTEVVEPAHVFISSFGRMKYLTPIYQALLKTNQRALAIKWYEENINFYHPYAVLQLAKLLGL